MRPAVTRTNLYSYLVTRHTGRAVRLSIEQRLAEYDRHVLTVLEGTGWRVRGAGGAAQLLGLNPSTLESRMKKLGIHRPGKLPE